MLVSYCVVNTNGRDLLLACLEAIERTTPSDLEHEILVLDNASDDGSAEAVRALGREIRLIALDRREGKAANDSRLLQEARGEFCLLLNEDSELQPGAVAALLGALQSDRDAGAAGAQLLAPEGRRGPLRLAAARARRRPWPERSSCTAASRSRAAARARGRSAGCSRAR